MTLLLLFLEFAKVGLFAVGGGLATIPFLQDMGTRTGWFTNADLTTMIAVSESTPGPMGVNMATYVGFETAGLPGAVLATLGLITPSIVVIIVIAGFLEKFRQSKTVDAVFQGLRPASTALIAAAGLSVAISNLFFPDVLAQGFQLAALNWKGWILAAVLWVLTNKVKKTKGLHPILFILAAAVVGVLWSM